MYYKKITHLTTNIGNNIFSYEQRKALGSACILTIPTMIQGSIDDLTIADYTVFEEIDHKNQLQTCKGLLHEIHISNAPIPTYIIDNHNHAFYIWHSLLANKILSNQTRLIHIDQHADMEAPHEFPILENIHSEDYLATYTNEKLHVGSFIIPAQYTGLVGDIIQIRTVSKLLNILSSGGNDLLDSPYILDIDIDFWSDHMPSDEEIAILTTLYKNAKACTIALSPFFIDLHHAIDITTYIYQNISQSNS